MYVRMARLSQAIRACLVPCTTDTLILLVGGVKIRQSSVVEPTAPVRSVVSRVSVDPAPLGIRYPTSFVLSFVGIMFNFQFISRKVLPSPVFWTTAVAAVTGVAPSLHRHLIYLLWLNMVQCSHSWSMFFDTFPFDRARALSATEQDYFGMKSPAESRTPAQVVHPCYSTTPG